MATTASVRWAFAAAALWGCRDPGADNDDETPTAGPQDDDDSGDDDSPPAFLLPRVPATVDGLCRAMRPPDAPVDWTLATRWQWTPTTPADRQVWDLFATALTVPQVTAGDGPTSALLISGYPTFDYGEYSYCCEDFPYSSMGAEFIRADSMEAASPSWINAYIADVDAIPQESYSAFAVGDFDGGGAPSQLLLPLMTPNLHPFPEGTWPELIQADGSVVATTNFADTAPPFPRLWGHATTYRPTWTAPVDRELIGGWSLWLERDSVEGEEWPDGSRGQDSREWLPADSNLDGVLDLPTGATVLDGRGSGALWTGYKFDSLADERTWSLYALDADCDARPEFVAMGGPDEFTVALLDDDGTELWRYVHPFEDIGAIPEPRPAIGDLDGDRRPEIVVRYVLPWEGNPETDIVALGLDGSVSWVAPLPEVAGVRPRAAPALFDFDGDGAMEVVAQTIDAVWLLDGRDGHVLSSIENWNPASAVQPMIADMDGDGSAEIVVHNRGWASSTWLAEEDGGMRILGPATGAWADAPARWDQGAWQAARWLRGGSETGGMPPFWREHNSLRAQLTLYPPPSSEDALANPQIATAVADTRLCPDSVDAWISVRNQGTARAVDLRLLVEGLPDGPTEIEVAAGLDPGESAWVVVPSVMPQETPLQVEVVSSGSQCNACDDTWPVVVRCP